MLASCCFYVGTSLDNGLGEKPPMGWNSWYHFYCNIDAEIVMDTADAMVITEDLVTSRDLDFGFLKGYQWTEGSRLRIREYR